MTEVCKNLENITVNDDFKGMWKKENEKAHASNQSCNNDFFFFFLGIELSRQIPTIPFNVKNLYYFNNLISMYLLAAVIKGKLA